MYLPKSQADKKKSLLGSSPDFSEAQVTSKVVDESEDDNDSNDDGSVEWASYWKPNITINLVADFTHIVVGVKQEEQIDHYEDQASIKQFLVSSYEQNLYPLLKQEIQQNHRELAFLNSGTPRSCGTCIQSVGLCFEIFIEFLIKASTTVFATPKDIVDPECMGISGFRLV
ncbi:hypothetical protein JHK87_052335 [Glycine soja]|nr:hypothetical protein JHK87_052335 [Glycine soja]